MANTTNLILPLIDAAQAQKHVTHNAGLAKLDALVELSVIDHTLTAPPGSPADGDRYLVAASATGAWAGQDDNIAAWQDGAWAFYPPREGWRCWCAGDAKLRVYHSSAWAILVGL